MFEWILSNRALWERSYVDTWTIPHTLFGVLIAFFTPAGPMGLWIGYAVTLSSAVLWEAIERFTGIATEESITNSIMDIVVAQVGFIAGIYLFSKMNVPSQRWAVFAFTAIIWIAVEIVGWLSYRHYMAGRAS